MSNQTMKPVSSSSRRCRAGAGPVGWVMLLVALPLAASPATAATLVVDPGGGGDHTTIQDAIDHAASGDVIELVDAVYTGPSNRDLDLGTLDLIVCSQSGDPTACVIDCEEQGRGFHIAGGQTNACVIRELGIRNGRPEASGAGIRIDDSYPTIEGCIIENCRTSALGQGGGICVREFEQSTPMHARILGNIIRGCHGNSGGAIYFQCSDPHTPPTPVSIVDNLIVDNHADGQVVELYGIYWASEFDLTGCTIVGNRGYLASICVTANPGWTAHLNLENTIAWGNWSGYSHLAQTVLLGYDNDAEITCAIECSNLQGGVDSIPDDAGVTWGAHNLDTGPRFCDPDAGDYTLAADSPCAPANNPDCGLIGACDVVCAGGARVFEVGPGSSVWYPTVQSGLDAALDGDSVRLANGTYTGDGNRDLDFGGKAITLRSASGNAAACVIDAGGGPDDQHRGIRFDDHEGPDSVVRDVSIVGGYTADGAGIRCDGETAPTIDGCIIAGNVATHEGGGLRCWNASPTIVDCWFEGNAATQGGGGIKCENLAAPQISSCTFVDNSCSNTGGAIGVEGSAPSIANCTFHGNWASNGGSAFRLFNSQADVRWSIIAAGPLGEAVSCGGANDPRFECCDIHGNPDGDWTSCIAGFLGNDGNVSVDPQFCDAGGGDFTLVATSPCAADNNPECGQIGAWPVGCEATTVRLLPDGSGAFPTIQAAVDAVVPGSVIVLGAGVYTGPGNRDVELRGKALTITGADDGPDQVVIDCQAHAGDQHRGFVVWEGEGPNTVIADLTIANGWVTDGYFAYGGGIAVFASAPRIERCILRDCTATRGGGLSVFADGAPTIADCVFDACVATDAGGGLALLLGEGGLSGCTIHGCGATATGGGVYVGPGTWSLTACTLHGNTSPSGSGVWVEDGAPSLEMAGCIVTGGSGGAAVNGGAGAAAGLSCCDVWGNPENWLGIIADQAGHFGNFSDDPLYCDAEAGNFTLSDDSPCAEGNGPPGCGRIGAHDVGCTDVSVDDRVPASTSVVFEGIAPNPFNPKTFIRFSLPRRGEVRLDIHDLRGRHVACLVDGVLPAGRHAVAWDGRGARGESLPSGVYCCRLSAGPFRQTRTLTLVR